MFGKLDDIEKQVLDLVKKIDSGKSKELKDSVNRLEETLNVAEISVCQWSEDRVLEMANQYFFDNLSLPVDASFEQIQQRIREVFYAEDLIRFKEEYTLWKADKLSNSFVFEFRRQVNDDTQWLRVVITRKIDEEKTAYTAICWNITSEKSSAQDASQREISLKEQNQKLSKLILDIESRRVDLVENQNAIHANLCESNAYMWSWKIPEGLVRIEMPSLEFEDQVSEDIYTFDKIIDKIHPEDVQKIQMDKTYNIYKQNDTFSVELRINYDGTGYNWFEFRGSVVERAADGSISYLRGIFLNIQNRKSTELSLLQEIDRLREADRLRNSIFSNLTQEIRTPLHAIVGFSDILALTEQKEERMKYLDVIKSNNEILLNIIEGVVEYSDTEPEEELKKDSVCLWEYMVELHQIYSMKIEGPVKLIFSNPYDSRRVLLDSDKLNQVFGILLNNAIQFTEKGSISYSYEYTDDKIIFSITDTGDGIASDKVENLFLHLEKSEGANNNFGLSVCKSLINKMNGQIMLNTKLGVGTSFTIEIPLVWDEHNIEKPVKINGLSEQKRASQINKGPSLPVILVAEDVLYSFLMLKTLLEDRYEVIHAENGEHAIELFKETNPVFVFMDIKMPVMDGIEATRRIRELSKNVPIIVLTAYAVRSLRKDAAEAGCTDMLTKPTTSKQINATIRKYMRRDI
ncbi:MAG: response regulator [Bacteroidales bacterium]